MTKEVIRKLRQERLNLEKARRLESGLTVPVEHIKEIDIVEEIGEPAVYEQLAEECTELAQASLKMARKLRDENPTPKHFVDIYANFVEEVADVEECLSLLVSDYEQELINESKTEKDTRWKMRIMMMKEAKSSEQSRAEKETVGDQ